MSPMEVQENSILSKAVQPFLLKLYNIVNDETTDQHIRWSQSGTSFIVLNQGEFADTILPRFFKHNKVASFVRQLNMYGFGKVLNIAGDDDKLEFANEFFIKNRPDLMCLIARKRPHADEIGGGSSADYVARRLECIAETPNGLVGRAKGLTNEYARVVYRNRQLPKCIAETTRRA